MRTLKRKICDAISCRASPFFRTAAPVAPFFPGSMVPGQAGQPEEEPKDPLAEGLKATGEPLAEHKPFKDWYDARLEHVNYTLWDAASPADRASILAYLGLDLGTAATAFSLDPRIRAALSAVNFGKSPGPIPSSPAAGSKYPVPERRIRG